MNTLRVNGTTLVPKPKRNPSTTTTTINANTTTTNNNSNINFICYTQDLTGSYNIRQYNKLLVESGKLYGNENTITSYGRYCKLYDEPNPLGVEKGGNKKAEPFYDYLAVRIATSGNDEFKKDFVYEKVNFKQKRSVPKPIVINTNNNSINSKVTVNRKLNINSKLKNHLKYTTKIDTTQLMLSVEGTGEYKTELEGYEGGEHIFILGPIPNASIKKILEKINTTRNNTNKKQKLFIHFQGETYNNWNKKIDNKYYVSNGGLFQSAFNIQGSIFNYLKLRSALKGANIYTVIPKKAKNNSNRIPLNNINKGNLTKVKKTITNFNMHTPSVYKKYYKEIIKFLNSNTLDHNVINNNNVPALNFSRNGKPTLPNGTKVNSIKSNNVIKAYVNKPPPPKLNITQCHQDIYDKDNYISVVKILQMASGKVQLYLSGVPVYDAKPNTPSNSAPGPPRHRGVGLNRHHIEYAKINKERTLDRHKKILYVWKQYMKQLPGKINNKVNNTNNINSLINNPTPYITNYWKISNNNRNIFIPTKTDNNSFNKLTTNSILFHPSIFVKSLEFYELSLTLTQRRTSMVNTVKTAGMRRGKIKMNAIQKLNNNRNIKLRNLQKIGKVTNNNRRVNLRANGGV